MPFLHLPERQISQYYCTNPTWHYSTSLSAYPSEGAFDRTKPTLIMLHGAGSSSAAQQRQFHDARLKGAFNMVALDARYCGWTTGAERDGFGTIEEVADTFLCTIDRLFGGELRFSLLAEGFLGSHLASWMAYKRPDQVQSIVMASPGWIRETDEDIARMREWVEMCRWNKDGQGDRTGLLPDPALKMINDYYFDGSERDAERQAIFTSAYQQRYGAGHSTYDMGGLMAYYAREAVPVPVLASVKVPVMILSGALDKVSPLAAAESWRAALTSVPGGATIQQLPSAPHLLMYAESGVANRLVFRFFSSAVGLAPPPAARPVSDYLP